MANTTIDTLLVRIETDLSGLKRGLDQVNKNVTGAGNQARDSFRSMEDGVNRVTGAAGKLVVALGAIIGAAALGGGIVSTIRQFEDLEAQLKSVTPNAEVAADAFELIKRFTATTTFNLDEVTQAFITLASSGIAPTTDVLQDLGNLAAARGQRIQDVAQAVQNAMTGEFEMLKRLGIVVRTDGDQITATFNGVATTMQKSGIVEYLRSIGREKFGDALKNQANTLSGAISNLQDAVAFFNVQIGEGGLRKALIEITKTITDSTNGTDSLARNIGMVLGGAVRGLNAALIFLRDNFREITVAVSVFLSVLVASKLLGIAAAMFTVAKSVLQAKTAIQALGAVTKANPIILIATVLAAIGSQSATVKDLMDQLTGSIANTGEISEQARKDLEELNAAQERAFPKPAEQATKKFSDTLADLNLKYAEAILVTQGFTKEQIAAYKSAGLLANLKPGGLVVSIDAASSEVQALNRVLETSGNLAINIGLGEVGKSIEDLRDSLDESDIEREFRQLFDPDLWNRLKTAKVDLSELRTEFVSMKASKGLANLYTQLKDIRDEIGMTDVQKFVRSMMKGFDNIPLNSQVRARAEDNIALTYGLQEAEKKKQQQIQEGIGVARQYAGEELRIADAMTAVTAAHEAKQITTFDYLNSMKQLEQQLRMLSPLYQSLENVISSATNTMTSALTSIFTGTAKAKDAFQNMFKGIADMVLQEVTRMVIVIPIMNAIRAAMGMPLAPSFAGSMGNFQATANLTGGYSLAQPGVQLPSMRAGGGSVNSGMPTIVGERGPELFVPHSAGRIVNGNNTASMMRGGAQVVVNQTVEISTGVQNTVRAEIQSLLPQIADVTKAAVAQSAMRGGSFRRAFA